MLSLYNSLSRKKEVFQSLEPNKVKLYVCGITPYDTTHLGHAFTYISFDMLIRTLTLLGYTVIYTQNVTDMNDRDNDLLKRAKEQHLSWEKLAKFWTDRFLHDMDTLQWIFPNNYLKASEHIAPMIQLIERIISSGSGYVSNGSVFLDTTRCTNFGKLSRLSQAQMLVKAKEFEEDITNPHKKHPLDITLWKASVPNQAVHIPSFSSPWGMGRPGWHIECSALAIYSLGEQIDIHGGGVDLQYPHHESETAQAEAATGKVPFAQFWVHTATVSMNNQKMSKSLGNLVLISDLLKTYSAHAVRFVLLSHHYREEWSYNESEFEKAEGMLKAIKRIGSLPQQIDKNEVPAQKERILVHRVTEALCNDLDSPAALQVLLDAVSSGNGEGVRECMEILGFTL